MQLLSLGCLPMGGDTVDLPPEYAPKQNISTIGLDINLPVFVLSLFLCLTVTCQCLRSIAILHHHARQ